MSTFTKHWKPVAAVVALMVIAAGWYLSPYYALQRMRAAAQAHDAATLNEYVDYPRLRESLKGQFAALFAAKAVKTDEGGAFAALGTALGLAFADKLIDTLVTPEALMAAMQSAQPGGKDAGDDNVEWNVTRQGVDTLILTPREKGAGDAPKVSFVLQRSGFAHWKLTEARLALPTS